MYIGDLMIELSFGESTYMPSVRTLDDMRDLLFDRQWLKKASNTEVYFMYRDLAANPEDSRIMKEANLRYDITLIPAGAFGREYVKTMGHYHPEINNMGLSYTEIYEVLEGEAHYLLQKVEGNNVIDVVVVCAKEGDKVVIPPNYGHVTINPSSRRLKMANLVNSSFSSIYEPYKKMRGAAYFELTSGEFIPNKRYGKLPPLRIINAVDLSKYGILKEKEIYQLIHELKTLDFLSNPLNHMELFRESIKL